MEKSKEFLSYEQSAIDKKKTVIAYWLAVMVLIAATLIAIGFITGNIMLVICLGAINALFGPVTLFFYLREVKRGVFRMEEDIELEE